jgi:hypothetical protein
VKKKKSDITGKIIESNIIPYMFIRQRRRTITPEDRTGPTSILCTHISDPISQRVRKLTLINSTDLTVLLKYPRDFRNKKFPLWFSPNQDSGQLLYSASHPHGQQDNYES